MQAFFKSFVRLVGILALPGQLFGHLHQFIKLPGLLGRLQYQEVLNLGMSILNPYSISLLDPPQINLPKQSPCNTLCFLKRMPECQQGIENCALGPHVVFGNCQLGCTVLVLEHLSQALGLRFVHVERLPQQSDSDPLDDSLIDDLFLAHLQRHALVPGSEAVDLHAPVPDFDCPRKCTPAGSVRLHLRLLNLFPQLIRLGLQRLLLLPLFLEKALLLCDLRELFALFPGGEGRFESGLVRANDQLFDVDVDPELFCLRLFSPVAEVAAHPGL